MRQIDSLKSNFSKSSLASLGPLLEPLSRSSANADQKCVQVNHSVSSGFPQSGSVLSSNSVAKSNNDSGVRRCLSDTLGYFFPTNPKTSPRLEYNWGVWFKIKAGLIFALSVIRCLTNVKSCFCCLKPFRQPTPFPSCTVYPTEQPVC